MTRYFLLFAVQELMLRWSGISSPIWKWVFTIVAVRPSYIWLGEASSRLQTHVSIVSDSLLEKQGRYGSMRSKDLILHVICFLLALTDYFYPSSIKSATFLIWDRSQILLASCPKSTIPKGCWDPSFCTTSYLPVFSHAGEAARKLCPATTSKQKIVAVPSC